MATFPPKQIGLNSRIGDVMTTHPNTIPIIIAERFGCVGCHMARFCTVVDVAAAYDLDPRQLVQMLRDHQAYRASGKSESTK